MACGAVNLKLIAWFKAGLDLAQISSSNYLVSLGLVILIKDNMLKTTTSILIGLAICNTPLMCSEIFRIFVNFLSGGRI